MRVLETYIMRRTFAIFAVTLLWVLAIVWTTQVLTRINIVTSSGQSAATFFEIAALVLPAVIPIVIPFALGIAVAQTLSSMNTDSELIVITASGSPKTTVVRPILLIAALASVASFAIENGVEPFARERLRALVSEARADLITSVVQEGTFQTIDDGLVIQISERLPDGRFAGIFLADTREEETELIYYADTGATIELNGEHVLVMQDGVVHRRNATGNVSIIRYQSYAFDLAEFAPATSQINYLPKDRTLGFLLNPDPADPVFQSAPLAFAAELHRRLTDWVYPLVFALVGLAVAGDSRSFRESRIHPLITTMLIALFIRWEGFIVGNAAADSPAVIPALYAVPLMAMAVCIWVIAANKRLEIPTRWTERMQDFWARQASRSIFRRRSASEGKP
ncbi:LPS export ABC transporter permease LptF [Aliihoeflea sp. 2WW]|uniref:LPS export ABC transporter permease LptF n=1 Tax=Aliihoeflea sp. 2WW TaxID=1381123 RepID=UPI0004656550|nr:LPS export ABC transporter permease LptF [Aliihoeflea sp. 2WW]